MHHGSSALHCEDLRQQLGVLDVAFEERDIVGHREAEPGRKVVDHRDRVTGVAQGEHGMAADVTGPAGDEDRVRLTFDQSGHAGTLRRTW